MSIEYYIINKCKRIIQPTRTPVFSKLFTTSIINITNCENFYSTEHVSTSDSLSTSGGVSISGGEIISSNITTLVFSNFNFFNPTPSNYFTKSIIKDTKMVR